MEHRCHWSQWHLTVLYHGCAQRDHAWLRRSVMYDYIIACCSLQTTPRDMHRDSFFRAAGGLQPEAEALGTALSEAEALGRAFVSHIGPVYDTLTLLSRG